MLPDSGGPLLHDVRIPCAGSDRRRCAHAHVSQISVRSFPLAESVVAEGRPPPQRVGCGAVARCANGCAHTPSIPRGCAPHAATAAFIADAFLPHVRNGVRISSAAVAVSHLAALRRGCCGWSLPKGQIWSSRVVALELSRLSRHDRSLSPKTTVFQRQRRDSQALRIK